MSVRCCTSVAVRGSICFIVPVNLAGRICVVDLVFVGGRFLFYNISTTFVGIFVVFRVVLYWFVSSVLLEQVLSRRMGGGQEKN